MRYGNRVGRRVSVWSAVILAGVAGTARAVIVDAEGGAGFYETAPAGEFARAGWQYLGEPGGMLGTAIAPNYFITAEHIGGAVGATFRKNGQAYTTTAYFDDPASDLRIWQVDGDLGSYAPLERTVSSEGKQLLITGRGTDAGAEFYTSDGQVVGWEWGADRGVQRWGLNTAGPTVSGEDGAGMLLTATFDAFGEATVSSGDSGGGFFARGDDGIWRLAGVAYAIDNEVTIGDELFVGAVLGQTMYASSIAGNVDWIDSVIGEVPTIVESVLPEPGAFGVAGVGMAVAALRRRRRAS